MKLKRKLTWDPKREQFTGDADANAMCSRAPRSAKYDLAQIMKTAGLVKSPQPELSPVGM